MARLDPAIRHAITPPEFGENMLHREQLVDRLHGEIPRSLVAIAAPAGYGKSTLLADFVAHADIPVCWVRVTEDDQDVMRLVSVILASLETRFRRLRDTLDLRAYAGASPASLARAFHQLIAEHVPETFVIVIDDIHLAHPSEEAMEFFDEFVVGLPENAVVFAAGREVLEVSLARLMAEGRLAGLGPHDLALTYEEARELTQMEWAESPSEDALEDLMQTTKGWVTGILLSEHSEATIDLAGGLPENLAYEYLATIVLNRLPEKLRRFLLEASVLPFMTAESCDQILGREDSEELLDHALSRGLFINVSSDTPAVYRFHPMFRALLNQTLSASDPDKFGLLRSQVAKYLEEEAPELAIELYLDIEEFERAAEIANDLAPNYYRLGRFGSLNKWFGRLSGVGISAPALTHYLAAIFYDRGNYEKALAILDSLEWGTQARPALACKSLVLKGFIWIMTGGENATKIRGVISEASEFAARSRDLIATSVLFWLRAYFQEHIQGDVHAAMTFIEKAIDHARQAEDEYLLSSLLREKVRNLVIIGELSEAKSLAFEAHQLSERVASPVSRTYTVNDLAHVEYIQGNYEAALSLYDEASSLARLAASETLEALTQIGKGEVFLDIGLAFQAARHFADGLEHANQAEHRNFIKLGCLNTAILHRRSTNYNLASKWLERARSVDNHYLEASLEIEKAAILARSAPRNAVDILKALKDDHEVDASEETRLFLWTGFANYKLGRYSEAVDGFQRALRIANLNSTEQFLAAELSSETDFYRYLADQFSEDPVFQVIREYGQRMEAFRKFYSKENSDQETISRLEIRTLGGASIVHKGQELIKLKPQALEFLIYLIDGGAVDKDRAGVEFWPDHPPGRQTANLHMAVYSIRKALGKEVIELHGNAYHFKSQGDVEYDVEEFERALDVARRLPPADPRRFFALTEAVSLYDGPFMPEFFSNWVQGRRNQLEMDYLDVASELAEEAIRRDQPKRALRPLREALRVDPYREDLNLSYLHLLRRLNRRTDVISHYRKYADILRRDFDLEPSETAKEVHDWAVGEGGSY